MPIKINGATSGSTTITAPASGSDETIELSTALAAKLGTLSVNAQTGTAYTLTTADPQRVVTMTNAAASTVTIPANATAAIPVGSSVQIVNLSTGVNTTVAGAGGVTVNGGPVVLSPGSSATLVKIATDSWMVQGQGAPGLTLITTAALSGSSVSINNCFTSGYSNYRIVYAISGTSADSDIRIRWRANGTDASGANYTTASWLTDNAGTLNFSEANAASFRTNIVYTALADSGSATIDVYNVALPVATTATAIATNHTATNNARIVSSGCRHSLTTAYDGLTLFTASGTFSGSVRVYGYRNF